MKLPRAGQVCRARPPFLQHGPPDRRWVVVPALRLRLAANADPPPPLAGQSLNLSRSQGGHRRTRPTNKGFDEDNSNRTSSWPTTSRVRGSRCCSSTAPSGPTSFVRWLNSRRSAGSRGSPPARVRRSGGPAGGFDMQAADIVALLDHLEVDRAHFVGHSEGAMIVSYSQPHPRSGTVPGAARPLPSSSWLAASDFADLPIGTGVRGNGGSLPGG